MTRRSRLLTLIAATPMLLVLIGLGTWQVQRLAWKTDLIDGIEAQIAEAPVPLPAEIDRDWNFRPVTVTGRYRQEAGHLQLLNRVSEMGRSGLHLVAGFEITEGPAAGRSIVVDRGWIPAAYEDPTALDRAVLPSSQVTLTGTLRAPTPLGWMQPENDPTSGDWYRLDPAEMGAALGLPAPMFELVLVRTDGGDAGEAAPRPSTPGIDLPNNHLQYAITWYSLAATLVVVLLLYLRRRPESAS